MIQQEMTDRGVLLLLFKAVEMHGDEGCLIARSSKVVRFGKELNAIRISAHDPILKSEKKRRRGED